MPGGFSTIRGIHPIEVKFVLLIVLLFFYASNLLIFKHDTSIRFVYHDTHFFLPGIVAFCNENLHLNTFNQAKQVARVNS